MIILIKKSKKILFCVFLISQIILVITFGLILQNHKFGYYHVEKDYLKLSQTNGNFSIDTFFPRIVWLEGQLKLNISSNQTGIIFCSLSELSSNTGFSNVNQTVDLIGNNISQEIILKAQPSFFTLPGIYRFDLNITGIHTYNENFEIIFVLGYSILTIISTAFFIVFIIVLVKHKGVVKSKSFSQTIEGNGALGTSTGILGKIKCPECRKTIDEGLTFCPECGARIPEFLRYNPPGM